MRKEITDKCFVESWKEIALEHFESTFEGEQTIDALYDIVLEKERMDDGRRDEFEEDLYICYPYFGNEGFDRISFHMSVVKSRTNDAPHIELDMCTLWTDKE